MLRLRCVGAYSRLDSGCEHDRMLELGDNRDSPLHGESMRHYHRCLRPPALHKFIAFAKVLSGNIQGPRLQKGQAMVAGRLCSATK